MGGVVIKMTWVCSSTFSWKYLHKSSKRSLYSSGPLAPYLLKKRQKSSYSMDTLYYMTLPVGVPETRIHHDNIRPNIIMFPAVIFQIILQCFTETTSYEVESYLKVNLKKI